MIVQILLGNMKVVFFLFNHFKRLYFDFYQYLFTDVKLITITFLLSDNLPDLLKSGKLEEKIIALPLIDVSTLQTRRGLRLAHLILTTLEAAYVWHKGRDHVNVLAKNLYR